MKQVFLISDTAPDITNDFIDAFLIFYECHDVPLSDFSKYVYRQHDGSENIVQCSPDMIYNLYRDAAAEHGLHQMMVDRNIILGRPFWEDIENNYV